QHTLVALVAPDDVHPVQLIGVEALVARPGDQDDHLVAQPQLLDGPEAEMVQATDDDVSGRRLRLPGVRVTGDRSGGIGRGWLSHGRECTGGVTGPGQSLVIGWSNRAARGHLHELPYPVQTPT